MILLRWIKRTVETLSAGGLKGWALRVAFLLVVLAMGGFLIAVSGVIPLKASSGHWAITRWFLEFSQGRSIATHSMGIKVPSLHEEHLVFKGAGHYETGCRPCHGSPGVPQPRVAQAMLPMPPDLRGSVSNRSASELFYIIRHGIKFTGMPAWPAPHRDDEVWAVVAFLRRLPEMNAADYRELALGSVHRADTAPLKDLLPDRTTRELLLESCGRCHGLDGLGRGLGAFPKLGGQKIAYLSASLAAYAKGERHSGIMEPIAAAMSPESIRELSLFYGRFSNAAETGPADSREAVDAMVWERGRNIATAGIPSQGIPACIECHGPATEPRNPIYPVLAGQYADYLVLQLELFKEGRRGGTSYAGIMRHVASRLTLNDMRAAALYFSTLDSSTKEGGLQPPAAAGMPPLRPLPEPMTRRDIVQYGFQ